MNKREEQIITEAKKRFQDCVDRESEIRQKALNDLEFLDGKQWTDIALRERARDERPALVVNRLNQFVLHISNAQKQNRVSAKVAAVDDSADPDTAEVIQGIIRNIEYNSHGTLAYDTAEFYAVAAGFGYFGHEAVYTDPLSFEQELRLRRFENPFQVYIGPHTLPDGSDAEYGFVFTDMTREEFAEEYPNAGKPPTMEEWSSIGDAREWIRDNQVRVVEYSRKRYEPDTLVKLVDGSAKLKSQLAEGEEAFIAKDENGDPIERETRICVLERYKLNAIELLEETVWPIDSVPIVKVTGQELTVNGKLRLKGIVRDLYDAQRQYNLMLSAQTEAVDSSKGPVVMYEGQEEGHEDEWSDLNRKKILRVNPTTVDGKPAPLPSRLPPNMSIPAMTEARAMASDDLKALTGIYDAALGARSNETSGRGILARQQQTETANFHFQDNLLISISHSCRMLVNLIPHFYDTPRAIRIVGEDESQKVVKINQYFMEGKEQKKYDLTVGKYDVVCTAGPSFQTRRQEGAQFWTQLASKVPMVMQVAPDLIAKMLDMPYSQEMAERFKKMLPPQLQDQAEQEKVPPAAAQKIAQLSQMVEAMTKELNAKNQYIETKQAELESNERIAHMKVQADMAKSVADKDTREAIAMLQAEVALLTKAIQPNTPELGRQAVAGAQAM